MVYIELPCHAFDLPDDLRTDLLTQIRSAEYYKARVARLVSAEVEKLIKDKTDVVVEERILYKHNINSPSYPKVKLSLFVQVKFKPQIRTLLSENYKISPPPVSNNTINCIDMCYECKGGEVEVTCGVQSIAEDVDGIKSLESTLSDWLRWIGDDAYALIVRRWGELYSDEAILEYCCENERVVYRLAKFG